MRCEHEHDDGAYVLGALAPADRAQYERHLASCALCREAVAEIAVLPGLLGRLDPSDFAELGAPAERSRVPDLVAVARTDRRRERRRRRWRYAGTALVAASLATVVGVGTARWGDIGGLDGGGAVAAPTSQPPRVAMQPVPGTTAPVSAEVAMRRTSWGTQIDMRCTYQASANHTKAYTFRLVAYGPDEQKEQVGSWIAAPGDTVTLGGTTRFSGADLVRLELQRYDNTPVLSYDVQ